MSEDKDEKHRQRHIDMKDVWDSILVEDLLEVWPDWELNDLASELKKLAKKIEGFQYPSTSEIEEIIEQNVEAAIKDYAERAEISGLYLTPTPGVFKLQMWADMVSKAPVASIKIDIRRELMIFADDTKNWNEKEESRKLAKAWAEMLEQLAMKLRDC